ncbi:MULTISPECIES: WhiB family transcriptional regulator [Catenuloplanes]|uniref:Transcriptional regulator WhiB n=1 Tax=Catenuloplanes niger TaxID=587534 RepID=A0AAE3ZP60_9ACTN|nr:WhiB family transcriptional regulator [Catenuloplanes niger]MDR7323392.1 hypothetical protein [Catenuloplanes niger]
MTGDAPPFAVAGEIACQPEDQPRFYPDRGVSVGPARTICARCPAEVVCLDWAIETDQRFGVWGGKTTPERQRIRREREGAAEQPSA